MLISPHAMASSPRYPALSHAFIEKYSDRIVYGTDMGHEKGNV